MHEEVISFQDSWHLGKRVLSVLKDSKSGVDARVVLGQSPNKQKNSNVGEEATSPRGRKKTDSPNGEGKI